ncbi:hypothetical protein BELL_0374g00080 [Botrytis elliptica]|uniref:Uncharacterized protein n=1 Tax=Botrytis elliptica TaxID=278938 RepID=A0A4Z1JHS3_9HELO|nr:hypothetical protein BELL_0374g00080 [Botrytis elliptica]
MTTRRLSSIFCSLVLMTAKVLEFETSLVPPEEKVKKFGSGRQDLHRKWLSFGTRIPTEPIRANEASYMVLIKEYNANIFGTTDGCCWADTLGVVV